jgi:hypothetical protein
MYTFQIGMRVRGSPLLKELGVGLKQLAVRVELTKLLSICFPSLCQYLPGNVLLS